MEDNKRTISIDELLDKKNSMSDKELADELSLSLVVLGTSSPDKRDKFRTMASVLDMSEDQKTGGVNFFFTDSGALEIVLAKTPEMKGTYQGNLDEKIVQIFDTITEQENTIRTKLTEDNNGQFDRKTVNIIGMVEDSGWSLDFKNEDEKNSFFKELRKELETELRPEAHWLMDKMEDEGFPGPNLKPFQEHLAKGFTGLMKVIYDSAEKADVNELGYSSFSSVGIVSTNLGKAWSKTFKSKGKMLPRDELRDKMLEVEDGEAINSDFVHVPNGQAEGKNETIDELREKLLTRLDKDVPADFDRRKFMEFVRDIIEPRRSTAKERKRPVNIAYVTNDFLNDGNEKDKFVPMLRDYHIVNVSTRKELLDEPHKKIFGEADVIILEPMDYKKRGNNLQIDPNHQLIEDFAVTKEIDPKSRMTPIIVDNRTGKFDPALKLVTDRFREGRSIGDFNMHVAETEDQIFGLLREQKNIMQRRPQINNKEYKKKYDDVKDIEKAPDDGRFTLFVGGGHANNSKRDVEDAFKLGYHAASKDWRLVTGGGMLEGSMGATHTGFVQYHLDQIGPKELTEKISEDTQKELISFYENGGNKKYNAEKILQNNPKLIDELADKDLIPRDLFYGYSMDSLLKMESPTGNFPPAITSQDTINEERRLTGLLAPGNKIFLPGSVGTDKEITRSIEQLLEEKESVADNDNRKERLFSDGTADKDGFIAIHNRDGIFDELLSSYGLRGDGERAKSLREKYNIVISDNVDELIDKIDERANKWTDEYQKRNFLEEIRNKDKTEPNLSR